MDNIGRRMVEIAQSTVRLPSAATGMFQALLLFFLLATDVLVRYRLAWKTRPAKVAP